MVSRDTIVLAQDAAFKISDPACEHHGAAWNQAEAEHAAALTQRQAREAAEPLRRICQGCPALAACARWAQIDEYTGIAAATAWVNGRTRPLHWVRTQSQEEHGGRRAS